MKIAHIYNFNVHPPVGGNHLHAYQLGRRFAAAGHELLTLGDPTMPGARAYPRTPRGFRELQTDADLIYVRIDGNRLLDDEVVSTGLATDRAPTVWEINAPANEALAYSWLGGGRTPQDRPFLRLFDRVKRTSHALRVMLRVLPEQRLRRRLARRADAAICVSEGLGRYARQELAISNVLVLPNGSDPELNHPGRTPASLPDRFEEHLKVLYAGSPIYPWQGLDVIEEVIRMQQGRSIPMVFLLLLNQRTSSIPDGENVHLLDTVPYEEVARYLNAADVCLAIHPDYPWSPWGFHNSPMKLFDYMSCARTVLASRVGQMKDVIRDGENGILCDHTPEDVLGKLEFLAGRPDLRRRMGAAARRDVLDQYNWDSIANRSLALFESVLEKA